MQILPALAAGDPSGSNHAIAGALQRLAEGGAVGATLAQAGGGLFAGAMLAWWVWTVATRAHSKGARALAGFGVCVMTVTSSLVWYHHLTLLVAPIAMLVLVPSATARLKVRPTGPDAAPAAGSATPHVPPRLGDVDAAPSAGIERTEVDVRRRVTALVALALMQSDRVWEVLLGAPPVASMAGYLLLTWISVPARRG